MDILSTPLFAEGRDPSGFAAVVKKHFVTLEGFKDVNGTAHALRKGGVANYVNHMMSAAPHGMQDMVRPHSGMTFLTHNSVQTQAAYDQGGRFQAGVNRSHTAGGDEQTTASTAGVLLSTSQLAHNLPAPLAKISFEDALLRMAEGGRNSQVYRSNFWLVKEVLEEVWVRISCGLMDGGECELLGGFYFICEFTLTKRDGAGSSRPAKTLQVCVNRVVISFFLKSHEISDVHLAPLRSCRQKLLEAARLSVCRHLWNLSPGGSSDAMFEWIEKNLCSLMTEELVTASGKERGSPWCLTPSAPGEGGDGEGEGGDDQAEDDIIWPNLESPSRIIVGRRSRTTGEGDGDGDGGGYGDGGGGEDSDGGGGGDADADGANMCMICYDVIRSGEESHVTSCQHEYHLTCWGQFVYSSANPEGECGRNEIYCLFVVV